MGRRIPGRSVLCSTNKTAKFPRLSVTRGPPRHSIAPTGGSAGVAPAKRRALSQPAHSNGTPIRLRLCVSLPAGYRSTPFPRRERGSLLDRAGNPGILLSHDQELGSQRVRGGNGTVLPTGRKYPLLGRTFPRPPWPRIARYSPRSPTGFHGVEITVSQGPHPCGVLQMGAAAVPRTTASTKFLLVEAVC